MQRMRVLTCLAALAASSAASAQDAPRPKAPKPVFNEAATIPCPQYGPGFYRAPGSSTCLKLSGQLRAEALLRDGRTRWGDSASMRAAAGIGAEARTETEFGPARAMLRLRALRLGDGTGN